METAWYFRPLVPTIGWFVCSWLLLAVIKARRMGGQGPGKSLQTLFLGKFNYRMGLNVVRPIRY